MLDDIDGWEFLHIILVLVHIRVVQAEEDAHVLQIDVGTVVDGHLDLVILVGKCPVHRRLHRHIQERLLHQDLLEAAIHILLTILHVGEQTVIHPLVAPTVEVIEDFLLTLLSIAILGIVVRLQQVRTEDAKALHRGAIQAQQVLSLRRLVQIGACLVAVEQIGQCRCLTRILHRCLVEVRHRLGCFSLLTIEQALQHQCRRRTGRIELDVLVESGFCFKEKFRAFIGFSHLHHPIDGISGQLSGVLQTWWRCGIRHLNEGKSFQQQRLTIGWVVFQHLLGLVVGIHRTSTIEVDVSLVLLQTQSIPLLHILIINGGVILQIFDV